MKPLPESFAFLGALWLLFGSVLVISLACGFAHGWDSVVFPGKRGGGYTVMAGLMVGCVMVIIPLAATISCLRSAARARARMR